MRNNKTGLSRSVGIAIVLIVFLLFFVGSCAYFGVFSPAKLLPKQADMMEEAPAYGERLTTGEPPTSGTTPTEGGSTITTTGGSSSPGSSSTTTVGGGSSTTTTTSG